MLVEKIENHEIKRMKKRKSYLNNKGTQIEFNFYY